MPFPNKPMTGRENGVIDYNDEDSRGGDFWIKEGR